MSKKLSDYNKKRNFELTPEPKGGASSDKQSIQSKKHAQSKKTVEQTKKQQELRFAVQHHIARRDHYDLRLEWQGVLLSWAVPKGPSFDPADKRLAVQVEDHPIDYRNFEGTIPKGQYGGGTVMLWDEGTYAPLSDMADGLAKGALKFTLHGSRLRGGWALVRIGSEGEKDNWLLIKEKDSYAGGGGISKFNTGIRSGKTMTQIAGNSVKNPFSHAEAQLAKLEKDIPEDDGDWLYEVKYDGYRILAFIEGGTVRLMTRGDRDYTDKFSPVAQSLSQWAEGRSMVLDGEIAVTGADGKTDFGALQRYVRQPEGKNLTYIIFDLLALGGADLRELPLKERKAKLEKLISDAPKNLYYSRHVSGRGRQSLLSACRLSLEGIIGKRANSPYTGGRNGDWIKLKCRNRQEFVIGGFTLSEKKSSGVSSLLLGVYEGKKLIYTGRAGTGLTGKFELSLAQQFAKILSSTPHFENPPGQRRDEVITWVKPLLIAEVEFAELTGDGVLRQASFKGLRSDKRPQDVVWEDGTLPRAAAKELESAAEKPTDKKSLSSHKASQKAPVKEDKNIKMPKTKKTAASAAEYELIGGVKITSPDKLMYGRIKKADVARYYQAVSKRMLKHCKGRVLSVVRCPQGADGECFYKKHPDSQKKGIVNVNVPTSGGELEEYFYIDSAAGFISEAQMGTLEFHIWGSRAHDLERPDMLVFDLDPDEGMGISQIRRGVKDLKSVLDGLSLRSYLKTSG